MEILIELFIHAFRHIYSQDIICEKVFYNDIKKDLLSKIVYAYNSNIDEVEIEQKLSYLQDFVDFQKHEEVGHKLKRRNMDIFYLVEIFSRQVLLYTHGEVICHFEQLQNWRQVTSKIGEDLFVAAMYAYEDYKRGSDRESFLGRNMIGHNDIWLNKILNRGISENHFHLFVSTPYFDLSWISLMNNTNDSRFTKGMDEINKEMRTPGMVYQKNYNQLSLVEMHMQAVLIRLYLFSILTEKRIELRRYSISWSKLWKIVYKMEKVEQIFLKASQRNEVKYLDRHCPIFCKLGNEAMKLLYKKRVCLKEVQSIFEESSFVEGIVKLDETKRKKLMEELLREELYEYELSLERCHWIFREQEGEIFEKEWVEQTENAVMYYLKHPSELATQKTLIQNIINGILYSNPIYQKDYALCAVGHTTDQGVDAITMCGERWFLYTMMRERKRKSKKLSLRHYNLFYAYLCIKESFRKELILSNDRSGFRNFQQYQKRKSWFTTTYTDADLARLAVYNSFYKQPIQSLEIRVMPGDTCLENIKMIQRYNNEIRNIKEMDGNENYYYVFHFRKKADEIEDGSIIVPIKYRHYAVRKLVKRQTYAMIHMREIAPETARWLRGIDACSDENVCRPEVFATAFRTLQSHTAYKRSGLYGIDTSRRIPQLHATYHVGEVFADILDGLRAIDEAIRFLSLDYGSRLGHANALGLDVGDWYKQRNYEIIIRKQDYLDNIVWLYHRLTRYRIACQEGLKEYLEKEFQHYFREIYGKVLDSNYIESVWKEACEYDKENYGQISQKGVSSLNFDIHNYYYSWKLRGDNPELYSCGYYKKIQNTISLWDFCSVYEKSTKTTKKRYIIESALLYHYYHYHRLVREYGNEPIMVEIPRDMVQVIAEVQKKLQEEIAYRGIAIEVNPSSNVMISSFKTYDRHPILRFYNKGLTQNPDELNDCAQINVSINTDDSGVFSTCLINEYALLASSLLQKRDENGRSIYKQEFICEWIDNIRQMGNEQSFLYDDTENLN